MTIEISVETYLFTCARCAAQWTGSYQVSEQVDDSGAVRYFYRLGGVPVEAPVSGNVECPNCHGTQARRDPLYGADADLVGYLPPVPPPRAAADSPAPPRPAARSWRRYKFSAVVSLDTAGRSRRQYLSGVPGLMVRCPSCLRPTERHYFPAVCYTDDDRPLRPGDKGVSVIISVPDDDAAGYFQSGQHFTLWDGTDVGHGTVAQRLFLQYR